MDKTHIYDKPILGIKESPDSVKYWNMATKSFEEKNYKESLLNLLNYMDPSIVAEKGNKDKSQFKIPHGSIVLEFDIKDDSFEITAPFLKLPEKKANIIMRQVSEINFSTIFLSQIYLKENELYFHYSAPLELCEPYKIYYIFYEMCVYADYYDDIFIDEMGAERLRELNVTEFSSQQKEQIWQKFQEYLKEAFDYIEYCQSKRWDFLGLDSALISLMKIDYYMQPQGKLRSDIEDITNKAYDTNTPPNELLERIKTMITELKTTYTREKFDESTYIPNFLISVKKRAELPVTKDILQKDFEDAKTNLSQSAHFSSVIIMLYSIYNLFYRNSVPLEIETVLNEGLEKAGGQPYEPASKLLFEAFSKVMEMDDQLVPEKN
ncbi:MAG: YbjN domain-containing protein [bacterium]|nr:YbjN domain-containing protein [bacterium]